MDGRRSPQEKKIRSYQRDRRNVYGESPAASRKGIRRRKAFVNRATRRGIRQDLHVDGADDRIAARRYRWRKEPDAPLGAYLEHRAVSQPERRVGPSRLRAEALHRVRQSGKRGYV